MSGYDDTLVAVSNEIRKHKPKIDATEEARAYIETNAFLERNRGFYACAENKDIILRWLDAHGLPITVTNLERGFKELAENAQLHMSEPDPTPRGYTPKHKAPYIYNGSHYDRTAIGRLKQDLALMTAEELKTMQVLNNWIPDFPPFLKA